MQSIKNDVVNIGTKLDSFHGTTLMELEPGQSSTQQNKRSSPMKTQKLTPVPSPVTSMINVSMSQSVSVGPTVPETPPANMQFGFAPGSGVSDAGILLADEIASTLNDREELRVVSLDLCGAFDRVWWRGLLAHLWNVGLCGRAYDLFSDYYHLVTLLLLLMEFYPLDVLFTLVFLRAVFGLHYFLICTSGSFPA